MLEIGKLNSLKIIKEVDFGLYLGGENLTEILLPKRYVPENYTIGEDLEVFIYRDSEDRIIATTEKPYAMVGEFAFLKVVSVGTVGAFLDWGLMKDILVPYREQKLRLSDGKTCLVYVYLDPETLRVVATTKIDKHIDKNPPEYELNQEVSLLIAEQTDLGYKAIVNHKHWGMLYKNEVFQKLKIGDKATGYVKKIREDHKIDLILLKPGYDKIDDITQQIYEIIKKQGGFVALNDKSPSEKINNLFGISKKNFKMAVGALYKQKLINIEEEGIRLT